MQSKAIGDIIKHNPPSLVESLTKYGQLTWVIHTTQRWVLQCIKKWPESNTFTSAHFFMFIWINLILLTMKKNWVHACQARSRNFLALWSLWNRREVCSRLAETPGTSFEGGDWKHGGFTTAKRFWVEVLDGRKDAQHHSCLPALRLLQRQLQRQQGVEISRLDSFWKAASLNSPQGSLSGFKCNTSRREWLHSGISLQWEQTLMPLSLFFSIYV